MGVRLLSLCLLLNLLCFSWAKCPPYAHNCEDCIQSGPDCAWCSALNPSRRCGTVKELKHSGCPESFVFNPQGSAHILTNISSMTSDTNIPLIQPRELFLRLRPGVTQSFNLTITRPTDQPITEVSVVSTHFPAAANLTISTTTGRDPSILQVNVQTTGCPVDLTQNQTGPWFIYLTPRGLSETVKLDITLECQCECTKQREEDSSLCNGLGALVCGQCECNRLYSGPQCTTRDEGFLGTTEADDDDACRSEPDSKICSGRGVCMSGGCNCHVTPDPERRFYGRFCECNDFMCPRLGGRLCGDHGECKCGQCICHETWTDEDCSCTLDTTNCMASNQQLCNGQGACVCGACKCDGEYKGSKCEDCPTCAGVCQMYGHCAECRAFGTHLTPDRCEKQCGHLTLTMVETKNDLPGQMCVRNQDVNCLMYYHVSNKPSGPCITVARSRLC